MEPLHFRRVAGRFATGVTVLTTGTVEQPHGMTANSFTSVSLRPPLILVCVDRRRVTHGRILQAGRFGVSVLGADQQAISEFFAGQRAALAPGSLEVVPGVTGVPLIAGALAHLECRVVDVFPGGDHSIFVAQVEHAAVGESQAPLIFFGGRYARLAPG
ncbi:flavin reductase family protein [Geochorda subterranea]|uniref:Flavin reductase family protein n=1 Tax=Geochorda subterranea TaxID=3109564 RepID=A0ABZ1BM44_9FIRM|nr:flavin reductase family protein [Limnochorda sp. LNt]WRP13531.1 flavin reductase family protein [Limnochorda sp. LNt]